MPGHFSVKYGAFRSLNFEYDLKQTQSRRSQYANSGCSMSSLQHLKREGFFPGRVNEGGLSLFNF